MIAAATSSSTPMPIWILRRGQPATMPAPSQAPTTDAAIIEISVVTSTSTTAMKMNASAKVGTAWPMFIVPGISSSETTPVSLYSDVVGANEPMPSVSRKSVTAPIASPSGRGTASAMRAFARRAAITQATTKKAESSASARRRSALAWRLDSFKRGPL